MRAELQPPGPACHTYHVMCESAVAFLQYFIPITSLLCHVVLLLPLLWHGSILTPEFIFFLQDKGSEDWTRSDVGVPPSSWPLVLSPARLSLPTLTPLSCLEGQLLVVVAFILSQNPFIQRCLLAPVPCSSEHFQCPHCLLSFSHWLLSGLKDAVVPPSLNPFCVRVTLLNHAASPERSLSKLASHWHLALQWGMLLHKAL